MRHSVMRGLRTTVVLFFTYLLQLTPGQTISLDLEPCESGHHVTTVKVGTPPQTFQVMFDSGSDVRWLPALRSTSVHFKNRKKYSHHSMTRIPSAREYKATYCGGVVRGFLVKDTVLIGDCALDRLPFLEAYSMTGLEIPWKSFDGVFGMVEIQNDQTFSPTIPECIFKHQRNPSSVFTFRFCGSKTASSTGLSTFEHGSLTFGHVPQSYHSGVVSYVTLENGKQWFITIDLIKYGHHTLCTRCLVQVDTGTFVTVGPRNQVAKVGYTMGASRQKDGLYEVDCGGIQTYPALELQIGGEIFHIPASSFMIEYNLNGTRHCFPGIKYRTPWTGSNWIMGLTWLRAFHTVFDRQNCRVGFAHVQC